MNSLRQICQEAFQFLRREKKWWLIPLLVAFLILTALVLFTQGSAPLSPFMYSVK
jgi:putative effector of murein hydrolase